MSTIPNSITTPTREQVINIVKNVENLAEQLYERDAFICQIPIQKRYESENPESVEIVGIEIEFFEEENTNEFSLVFDMANGDSITFDTTCDITTIRQFLEEVNVYHVVNKSDWFIHSV